MSDLKPANRERSISVRKWFLTCVTAAAICVAGAFGSLSGATRAQADGIYFNGVGIGFGFGNRGYRGGAFYAPYGRYGPPYRPYGAPYYYHPYDMRAYPYRSRVYVNPPRYRGQPQRVPYTKTGLAPFTPDWTAYCARKFKSFNPNTGMYLAHSGKYRFCR
ncbi:BA14K family protein [Stappia sp. BW2]|uniref:BA14K family protein n=1 Tax=Stappia sp. BW2 TaxID=2592622 RepID=UPI0011DE7E71|nr:BA14K family protein [Stappia sp. BW2]TYC67268.1 BA14K family protein [Stappia sp. BW2]